ncbi:hypothetical protein OUZ56_001848 [Daphnia magna]|uniref:Uncharacterized protein n=1 Tax=Daphnia magna TaxID=35525 RepID=A0ABR0A3Y0_9CRUS|nr:hypothetical protein OUZ56_001848 [Daphnia magna]
MASGSKTSTERSDDKSLYWIDDNVSTRAKTNRERNIYPSTWGREQMKVRGEESGRVFFATGVVTRQQSRTFR